MAVEGGLPIQACALSLPEMPLCRDLKSGDSLVFTTPPPPGNFNGLPHPDKLTQPPMGMV